MSIILKGKVASTINKPDVGGISIFYDINTSNVATKSSSGNVINLGGGQTFQTFAFNETNDLTTNLYVGTIFLGAGTLSPSSSVFFGTLTGQDTATVNIFNEVSGTIIATWTVTNEYLQTKLLNSSSIIPVDDYYSIRFKVQNGTDTAILRGLRLVFDLMAKIFDVNRLATYGGSTAMFYLKETLKSASWVVTCSSDGTTLYATSDGITTDNSGSGGMNNSNAWFLIRDPEQKRAFTVIRGTGTGGDRNWNIQAHERFGKAAFGTASITVPPQPAELATGASGSATYIGSGSVDCDLTFDTANTFYAHTIAISGSHNGVWPFFHFCSASGSTTGKTMTLFHCDPLLSGTTEPNDTSPNIWKFIYCTTGTNRLNSGTAVINIPIGMAHQNTRTHINGKALTFIGLEKSNWVVQLVGGATSTFTLGTVIPVAIEAKIYTNGTGSVDGTDVLIPITWINSYSFYSNYKQIRGISAYGRINLNGGFDGAGRYYPDTINLATNAYVMVGSGYAIPWPENITPI